MEDKKLKVCELIDTICMVSIKYLDKVSALDAKYFVEGNDSTTNENNDIFNSYATNINRFILSFKYLLSNFSYKTMLNDKDDIKDILLKVFNQIDSYIECSNKDEKKNSNSHIIEIESTKEKRNKDRCCLYKDCIVLFKILYFLINYKENVKTKVYDKVRLSISDKIIKIVKSSDLCNNTGLKNVMYESDKGFAEVFQMYYDKIRNKAGKENDGRGIFKDVFKLENCCATVEKNLNYVFHWFKTFFSLIMLIFIFFSALTPYILFYKYSSILFLVILCISCVHSVYKIHFIKKNKCILCCNEVNPIPYILGNLMVLILSITVMVFLCLNTILPNAFISIFTIMSIISLFGLPHVYTSISMGMNTICLYTISNVVGFLLHSFYDVNIMSVINSIFSLCLAWYLFYTNPNTEYKNGEVKENYTFILLFLILIVYLILWILNPLNEICTRFNFLLNLEQNTIYQ